MRQRGGDRDSGVFRITGARPGLQEDVRGRQCRYVISMVIRTVSVILTVVLWHVALPAAIATLAVGLLLPYIAVVIANGGRENATSLPSAFITAPSRPMLTTDATGHTPAERPRPDAPDEAPRGQDPAQAPTGGSPEGA